MAERQLRADFDASVEIDRGAFARRSLALRLLQWLAYQLRTWL